jgi:hypothetical protein
VKVFRNAVDRFCYNHPRFGIPNLMLIIIAGQALVYLMDLFSSSTFSAILTFSRSAIFRGEIWRLVSFVFVPPSSGSLGLIGVALTLYFYFFIGTTLERQWGSGRFTCYYLVGMLVNIVAGLIVGYTDMYYINMSLFLVFASLYGDIQFLVMFLIPVKARWLGWADLVLFLVGIVTSRFPYNLLPLVALAYFILFFGEEALELLPRSWQGKWLNHRRKQNNVVNFQKAARKIQKEKNYLHKCEVCGRTDTDYPDLEFRYCSRCEGYHCYCMDHINNHQHHTE